MLRRVAGLLLSVPTLKHQTRPPSPRSELQIGSAFQSSRLQPPSHLPFRVSVSLPELPPLPRSASLRVCDRASQILRVSVYRATSNPSISDSQAPRLAAKESQRPVYPFAAIVGQDEMKLFFY